MAPGYGIDSIGGFNSFGGYDYWANLMNNQYFKTAWQTPNVNFKGNNENKANAATGSSETKTNTNFKGGSEDGAIPVTQPATEEESGSVFGTLTKVGVFLALGGGALYMLKKGDFGKASEVVKSVFSSGKAESANSVANVLKRLTAVKNKSGEIRYMIPGKTTKFDNEAAAKAFTEENCIKEAISLERKNFNPENSAITEFTYSSSTNNYKIKIEDGNITSIVDKDGKEILKDLTEATSGSAEAKKLEAFENILRELRKEKDVDTSMLDGIKDIKYSNTFGDDVLEMSLAKYGDDPVLKYFTTLQRFKFTDKEMQSLVLGADEKVFAEYAGKELLTKGSRFSSPRLADGLRVSTFSKKIDGTNEFFFEGEKLVKIRDAAGNDYPIDSAKYIELAAKYEKDINKLIKKVYEDRTEIPVGATIIPE